MRVLFAALPGHGHVYPLVPLAVALQEAGAEVRFATGWEFQGRLPVETVLGAEAGWSLRDGSRESRLGRPGPSPGGPDQARRLFLEISAPRVLAALQAQVERWAPDLVVAEQADVGAVVAARAVGTPVALFSIVGWGPRWDGVYDGVVETWGPGLRRPDGLPVAGRTDLADVFVEAHPAVLREAPAGSAAAVWSSPPPFPVVDLRPRAWSEPAPLPRWLVRERRTGDRPRVLVTLGTIFASDAVLARTAAEVAEAGGDVLAVAGPGVDASAVEAAAPAVHVETFVDQVAALGHVDLVVHHGGSGTVVGALEHALPQVLVPQGADQFWNAECLVAAGAARAVAPDAEPGAVRTAVAALLDPAAPERDAARRLRAEVEDMPAPAEVAALLLDRFAR